MSDHSGSGASPGAGVNEWIGLIRRARLHATTKLIALLMASYADPDGTHIFPGVARLAVQSGHGYRTVQRELARLRAMGLIEQMPRTGTRRSWSSCYRLIFADGVLEKAHVPSPALEEAAVDNLARRYRGKHRPGKSARRLLARRQATARHMETQLHATAEPAACENDSTLHRPLPNYNPPSGEIDLRETRTGNVAPSSKTMAKDRSTGRGPRARGQSEDQQRQPDLHTRRGTEQARMAHANRLNEWLRAHDPETGEPLPVAEAAP